MHTVEKIFLASVFSGLSAAAAFGQGNTFIVDQSGGPGFHFTKIQPALDAAQSGDLVLVRNGTYLGDGNMNLTFHGKNFELRSENGSANCIIDPQFEGRGFVFNNGETAQAKISGFTIRNAGISPEYIDLGGGYWIPLVDGYAGGMLCYGSSPTVENCSFENCFSYGYEEDPALGGAVFLSSSNAVFQSCSFADNNATCSGGVGNGGAIFAEGGSPRFLDCLIVKNYTSGYGGAVSGFFTNITIRNCTIVDNSCVWSGGGGGILAALSTVYLENSILRNNQAGGVANQGAVSAGEVLSRYSNLQGGPSGVTAMSGSPLGVYWGAGSVDLDPQFADPASGNYRLLASSPCIDAASNALVSGGSLFDLDGNPRLLDDPSVCDTGEGEVPVIDMGTYEFQPAPGPWMNLGGALAGEFKNPCLVGTGDLTPGSMTSLQLSSAAANASAFLVLGLTPLNLPIQGGILVPQPDRVVKLVSGASGELSLNGALPAHFPSGTTLYFQFWIADPAGPMGFAASNALEATTP